MFPKELFRVPTDFLQGTSGLPSEIPKEFPPWLAQAPPPPTQSITPDQGPGQGYEDSFDEMPPESPEYTPESIISLGEEPPEYSLSWRWDLRKIKIFKTDNTLSPIDPFTLFYRISKTEL